MGIPETTPGAELPGGWGRAMPPEYKPENIFKPARRASCRTVPFPFKVKPRFYYATIPGSSASRSIPKPVFSDGQNIMLLSG
ncbi:MAG: hypothetical protein ACE5GL_00765 [Calditrichia bacterium]